MSQESCSTATPNSSGTTSYCSVTRTDSGFSDVSDLLPQIDTTCDPAVPDSVLLIQLAPSLFSPVSKVSDCPPERTPSNVDVTTTFKKLNSRVQFEEEEVKLERGRIEILHGIICRNNLTVSRLFAFATKELKEVFPFLTDAGFEMYIKQRSFIFEVSNTVHNRGFGYRENFVNIVRYVDSKCQEIDGCTVKDIADNVINKLPVYMPDDPHVSWNDSWFLEHKMNESEVFKFLSKEHAEIFNVENNETDLSKSIVRLTRAAYGIASLWHDCFPPMPSTLIWDESRVYSFTTSISYVHEHHAITGVYRGRLVYIHRSRVGPPDLRRALTVGGVLHVTAHMTWNTTAQFRALSVINNFSNYEIKKIGGRSQSERDEFAVNQRRDARPTFVYRTLLRRAADSELNMIKFADELLAEAMYSHDGLQRRLHKYKTTHRNAPFTNFQELEYFLSQRPHLYIFDTLGARHFSIAIAFIQMVSDFGFVGASKQELRYRLMNSSYPLKSTVVERTLDEYIQQISPVLEVIRLLNPVEEIVMLRGTYIPEEKIFVHHFKPGFLPID